MLPSVLTVLGILLILALLVALATWVDLVVGGERVWVEHEKAVRRWRPPFARGSDLLAWARALTGQVVNENVCRRPEKASPGKLAAEIQNGAMQAMLPFAAPSSREATIPCPAEGQGMVGITAPEAFEIADYLRKNVSRAERERIHDFALHNAMTLADAEQLNMSPGQLPCPLQGSDRVCCVYAARPLRCRPLHAEIIAQRFGGGPSGSNGELEGSESFTQSIERGVEQGLVEMLESAGLDAHIYELNSALVAALDTPGASGRWMKGEDVFAGCKVVE